MRNLSQTWVWPLAYILFSCLVMGSGCKVSSAMKEIQQIESEEGPCNALKFVETALHENGPKPVLTAKWIDVAVDCDDDEFLTIQRFESAVSAGVPITEGFLQTMMRRLVLDSGEVSEHETYHLDVRVPEFVTHMEIMGDKVAVEAGHARWSKTFEDITQWRVNNGVEIEFEAAVWSETSSARAVWPRRVPLKRLPGIMDTEERCELMNDHGMARCIVSVATAPNTQVTMESVGDDRKVIGRCLADENGKCGVMIPVVGLGILSKIIGRLDGYSDTQTLLTMRRTWGAASRRDFEQRYCFGAARCDVRYTDLEADPGYYKHRLAKLSGTVQEVSRDGNLVFMRVASSSYGQNDFVVAWYGDRLDIRKGRSVTVYGAVSDPFSYKTVANWQRTVPRLVPVAIDVSGAFHWIERGI